MSNQNISDKDKNREENMSQMTGKQATATDRNTKVHLRLAP